MNKFSGVIAYPTETVYGLGCDPRDVRSIKKIIRMKKRDSKKSLLLIASSIAQVRKVAILNGTNLALARQYWPGPLTLILPALPCVLPKLLTPRGEVAIRVTSSEIAKELCQNMRFPIVSTSANISGQPECRSGRAVKLLFAHATLKPDVMIDGGALPRRKSSTIVRIKKDGSIEILRQGAIKV